HQGQWPERNRRVHGWRFHVRGPGRLSPRLKNTVRPKPSRSRLRQKFIAGLPCNELTRELRRSCVQIGKKFVAGLPCSELTRELRRSCVQIGKGFVAGLVIGGCNAIHFSAASKTPKHVCPSWSGTPAGWFG